MRNLMFSSKYSVTIWVLLTVRGSGLGSVVLGRMMDRLRVETGALSWLSLSWWMREQFLLQRLWWSWSRRLVSSLPKTRCSMCLLDQYYNWQRTPPSIITAILPLKRNHHNSSIRKTFNHLSILWYSQQSYRNSQSSFNTEILRENIQQRKRLIPVLLLLNRLILIIFHVSWTIDPYQSSSLIKFLPYISHNFIMNYNQLTYHKASPFHRQGYLPDRAWYNRKPKQYPSEIPTGQQYFTDSGRKHYQGRFNHSEIQETGVLKSPEKYPYQNRIAMDKTYMRSLDTTDIEGAGSGTRVNEAVRYKLRAQEELARRYHQSLDMRQNKEHEYEERRRQLAIKQYETVKNKKEQTRTNESIDNSRVNPEQQLYKKINTKPYIDPPKNRQEDNKYINLLPKPYYKDLEQEPKEPQYVNKYIEPVRRQQSEPLPAYNPPSPPSPEPMSSTSRLEDSHSHLINANDRHKSNPAYVNNYDHELQRRREEYLKTIELDHASYNQLSDKKQFRKHNPTNLSFSLAGQSVVGGRY